MRCEEPNSAGTRLVNISAEQQPGCAAGYDDFEDSTCHCVTGRHAVGSPRAPAHHGRGCRRRQRRRADHRSAAAHPDRPSSAAASGMAGPAPGHGAFEG